MWAGDEGAMILRYWLTLMVRILELFMGYPVCIWKILDDRVNRTLHDI